MLKILIIEDEKLIANEIASKVKAYGTVDIANNIKSAEKKLSTKEYTHMFVDLTIEKRHDGLNYIKKGKEKGVQVAALTSDTNQRTINKVLKELKADQYFDKMYFLEEWSPEILELYFFPKAKINLNNFFKTKYITVNKRLIKDIENVIEVSKQKDRVTLIIGPTGVGKTTLASLIHKHSRIKGAFIEFNVNQVSPELLESTLFGHKKGSFTGAIKDTKGLLEQANNGTLFLDEIGDISIQMQQKLLTAIESKEIRPIGSEGTVKTNFKLICAGKNIFEKVKNGNILPDFYYRIHDIVLNIEPIHQRPEDINHQVLHFIKIISEQRKIGRIGISSSAQEILKTYLWPGNTRELVKELNNIIDSAGNFIDVEDIPKRFLNFSQSRSSIELSDNQVSFLENNGLKKFISEIENLIIRKYIKEDGYSKLKLSKYLGVNKQVIYRMADQNSTGDIYEQ